MRLKVENYLPVGEQVLISFEEDQSILARHFVKMDAAYLDGFRKQLDVVRGVESTFMLTEAQKVLTQSLYKACDEMTHAVDFLRVYGKQVGLNMKICSTITRSLRHRNVEGAVKDGRATI